jgi:hypothetical protein
VCEAVSHPHVVGAVSVVWPDPAPPVSPAAPLSLDAFSSLGSFASSSCTIHVVMERFDADLADALARQRVVTPPRVVLAIARQLLAGIAYLHSRGILHRVGCAVPASPVTGMATGWGGRWGRGGEAGCKTCGRRNPRCAQDIKPANVLLRRDGRVALGDLGLARFMPGAPDTAAASAAGAGVGGRADDSPAIGATHGGSGGGVGECGELDMTHQVASRWYRGERRAAWAGPCSPPYQHPLPPAASSPLPQRLSCCLPARGTAPAWTCGRGAAWWRR